MNTRYYGANEFFKTTFGEKVYKLALEGGYTCPNRDGTVGIGGCAFCDGAGSGFFAEGRGDNLSGNAECGVCTACESANAECVGHGACESVNSASFSLQLERAISRVRKKFGGQKFIAYFQSFTATHAPIEYIKELIRPALENPSVCALSIGTRPDCLPLEVLNVLKQAAQKKPLFIELGLQTSNEKTAKKINRCYKNCVYEQAVLNLHKIGANVITHVILGLPGESVEDMLNTVKYACRFTDGIKLQLLHVIKNTPLAESYARGEFTALSLEEYADILCKALAVIPKNVVIHRLTGDAPKVNLIAPLWSGDKKRTLNYINSEIEKRGVFQGSALHV